MQNIKYVIAGIMLVISLNVYAKKPPRIRVDYNSFVHAVCINGYWSQWKSDYIVLPSNNRIDFYSNHFIIHYRHRHPSNYFMKVSYEISSKRIENEWYVYYGNVEYYTEKASDRFYFDKWPNDWPYVFNGSNDFKKVSPATVKFHRNVINVFFENNAIGIQGEYF